MKTLRLIGMAIVAVMLCFNFTACSSDNEVEPVGPQKTKEYTVSLGFTGEISISESPLSRTSGNDLYGIQVYSCPNVEGATTYSYYAYGLFDDTSLMTIKLMEGYRYKFVATMVVDGKNKIFSDADNNYSYPFHTMGGKPMNLPIAKSFTHSNTTSLGFTYMSAQIGGKLFHYPNIDTYYGKHEDYIPVESGKVSIKMERMVFGLKIIANNLTEGTLTFAMNDAPIMEITYPKAVVEEILTFYQMEYLYNKTIDSETIPAELIWTKADGVVVPLGTHNITFKRNVQTTVTIKVADVTTENGIGIELESAEMGTDNITIENGEIVDTDVETETGEQ